jgi:hypothetical protein
MLNHLRTEIGNGLSALIGQSRDQMSAIRVCLSNLLDGDSKQLGESGDIKRGTQVNE